MVAAPAAAAAAPPLPPPLLPLPLPLTLPADAGSAAAAAARGLAAEEDHAVLLGERVGVIARLGAHPPHMTVVRSKGPSTLEPHLVAPKALTRSVSLGVHGFMP